MLTAKDRSLGLDIARALLVGRAVSGYRFVTDPVVIFDELPPASGSSVYLHIESGCQVLQRKDESISELGRGRRAFEDLWPELVSLARSQVSNVRMAELGADLLIDFANGRALWVSGVDAEYESWTLGREGGSELIVALAGGGIAIWT